MTERKPIAPNIDNNQLVEDVFIERLRLYYKSLKQSVVAILVSSSCLLAMLWNDFELSRLLGWYFFVIMVTIYRLISWRLFAKAGESRHRERQWYIHMLAGSMLSGLSWGLAGYLLFSDNLISLALLAFVIAGMSAGGVMNLSYFIESALSFLALVILPFVIRLLQSGGEESMQMAGLVILFSLLISVSARRVNQTLVDGLMMKFMYERAEDKIKEQAFYDELTQLPNRRLLLSRMEHALARAERTNSKGALLYLDLDNFKRVNDSYGHVTGDALLQQVGLRLRQQLRKEDTAARLGGDEFVVLLTDMKGDSAIVAKNVQIIVNKLLDALVAPMDISGHEIRITASIGVSLFPDDSRTANDLLKHADTAMYQTKDQGKNGVRFFLQDMQAKLNKRLALEKALYKAIENNELRLFIQPFVEQDGKIFGGEALVRWFKDGKMVPPDEFIPIAEESGLIYLIGNWVMNQACQYLHELSKIDVVDSFKYISINVSPREFHQKNYVEQVTTALNKYSVSGKQLEIEVTESLLLTDVGEIIVQMEKLRQLGISFSIDDFGTGYSSLSYLKKLPADTLKIDRSFIQDVLTNNHDATIVKTVLSMANMLGLKTISEGVEDTDMLDFLRQNGGQYFQGYLFGKPMPFEEFVAKIKKPSSIDK